MDLDFSDALLRVRGAMAEAGVKSSQRRLTVLQDASCRKGCSGCCRRMVHITVAEAVVMQEYLEKAGRWQAVFVKCTQVLASVRDANPLSWFRMNIECPVLEGDSCQAYAARPPVCSVHFARSKPELCHPWSTEPGEFLPVELDDVYEDFLKVLHSTVDGHGILSVKVPLPAALLMAHRVRHQPGLTPEALIRMIYNELA